MLTDDERHIPVKLCTGGPAKFAEGGLAQAADAVAGAGRFGDEMVVHLNRREFEELRQKWGEPHINPETGLPEFWNLKDLWHSVKPYVAPVGAAAVGAFAPVVGETIGSVLPGVADVLGSTGTQALGAGLLGAGAGYLLNGGKGALYGGLGGIAGAYGGDFLKNGWGGSALGAALGGGDTLMGDAANSVLGEDAAGIAGGVNKLGGEAMGSKAIGPALLMSALNLGASALDKGQSSDTKANKKALKQAQVQFNKPLPVYINQRTPVQYAQGDVPDYTTQGERSYFSNNSFADGGSVGEFSQQGYVQNYTGDHGRSDKIKALLSPNEYVIDAETTALLGNGSPEAGAAALDRMRANIRRHKGSALAAGAISPDAMPPEQYMGA